MTTYTQEQGARSSSLKSWGTLASGTFDVATAIDLGAQIPMDVTVELTIDPNGTPTGDKHFILYAKLSLDNTNFTSGPETGTDATNANDLHWVGTMVCNDGGAHTDFFSLAHLPVARYVKFVGYNGLGVALSSGSLYKADITGDGT